MQRESVDCVITILGCLNVQIALELVLLSLARAADGKILVSDLHGRIEEVMHALVLKSVPHAKGQIVSTSM